MNPRKRSDSRRLSPNSETYGFEVWAQYFAANVARHERLDALIPWGEPTALSAADAEALARSLQRFELGESGEGTSLRSKAGRRGDATYDEALVLFIAEEQKHSALFAGALARFGAERLTAHWSDAAFVVLRRLMGLRTEVTLFLVAETTAMGYFDALGRSTDPVIRGVARRVVTDEVEHIRFQIDQLRVAFAKTPRAGRLVAAGASWVVAVAAATVVAIDHGAAMRVCGLGRYAFWRRALGTFTRAASAAFLLDGDPGLLHGPSVALTPAVAAGGSSPAAASPRTTA